MQAPGALRFGAGEVQHLRDESGDLSARLACERGVWVARRACSAVTVLNRVSLPRSSSD